MPSIKVVPEEDGSRVGYAQVQEAFGPGAPARSRSSGPRLRPTRGSVLRPTRGSRPGRPSPGRRPRSSRRCPRPIRRPSRRQTIERLRDALPAARSSAAPPPRTTTSSRRSRGEDAARHRRRARARLPSAAARAAGAADRGGRRLTNLLATGAAFGVAKLIFQDGTARAARLRVAGLPRRLGAGVLLRDDLRDLDGLHRVPARLGQGALRSLGRPARGDGRRRRPLRPRDLRRRGGDGRRLLHLRPLRAAPAEGDGRDPRHRRAARRDARPPRPHAGPAAPARPERLVCSRAGSTARTLISRRWLRRHLGRDELRRLVGEDHEIVLVDRGERFSMGLRKLWELSAKRPSSTAAALARRSPPTA